MLLADQVGRMLKRVKICLLTTLMDVLKFKIVVNILKVILIFVPNVMMVIHGDGIVLQK